MRQIHLRGIPFYLHDSGDLLSGAIERNGDFWEADILDYIRDNHPEHMSILDIGANIGNHSVYFANFLKYASIMCFEPETLNYDVLTNNMSGYSNIGLAKFAVSDKTGTAAFIRNGDNFGAHRINDQGDEIVKTISIDKIALGHVTLMKIDVEGHEPAVLDGATDTIIRCKPLILIEDWDLEYHRILSPLGYEIEKDWEHHKTYLWRPV